MKSISSNDESYYLVMSEDDESVNQILGRVIDDLMIDQFSNAFDDSLDKMRIYKDLLDGNNSD